MHHMGHNGGRFAVQLSALLSGAGALGFLIWYMLKISAGNPQVAEVDRIAETRESIATISVAADSPRLAREDIKGDRNRMTQIMGQAIKMHLIGVMQMGHAQGKALIRAQADDQGNWVSVGDMIQGWQLREIARDSALVEKEGQLQQLQLSEAIIKDAR